MHSWQALIGCAATLAVVAVVSGCAATAEIPSETASEPAPASASPQTSQPEHRSTTPDEPLSAEQRVNNAVLGERELGPMGWEPESRDPDDPHGGGDPEQRSDRPECHFGLLADLRSHKPEGVAVTAWAFDNGTAIELLESWAFAYRDEAMARDALTALQATTDGCTMWAAGGVDGEEYAFGYNQDRFNVDIGDQSVGVRRIAHAINFPEVPPTPMYVVAARTADTVQLTSFVSSAQGAPGISFVTEHAQAAAALVDLG